MKHQLQHASKIEVDRDIQATDMDLHDRCEEINEDHTQIKQENPGKP